MVCEREGNRKNLLGPLVKQLWAWKGGGLDDIRERRIADEHILLNRRHEFTLKSQPFC